MLFRQLICPIVLGFGSIVVVAKQPALDLTRWPRGGDDTVPTPPPESPKWSSFVEVDPSKLLTILVQKTGLIVTGEEKKIAKLIHCDEAKLNVKTGAILVKNLSVGLPGSPPSLQVRKIHVSWDSYVHPCLEVEVEDVNVLVEFKNLFLTKNNWNELADNGFPPKIMYKSSEVPSGAYNLMRIGRLDLKGKVVLHTHSKPLNKPLTPELVFSLDNIQDLNKEVRQLSEENKKKFKRPGCTSDEIYELYRAFFNSKIKAAIKVVLEDIASSQVDPKRNSITATESKKLLSSAKKALSGYVEDATTLSKEQTVKDLKRDILQKFGKENDPHAERIVSDSFDAVMGSFDSLSRRGLQRFQTLVRGEETAKDDDVMPDDILFADW